MVKLKYGIFSKNYRFSPFRQGSGLYAIGAQGKAPGSREQQRRLANAVVEAVKERLYEKMHPHDVARTFIAQKISGQTEYTKTYGYARERRKKTPEQIIAKCKATIARIQAEIGKYYPKWFPVEAPVLPATKSGAGGILK